MEEKGDEVSGKSLLKTIGGIAFFILAGWGLYESKNSDYERLRIEYNTRKTFIDSTRRAAIDSVNKHANAQMDSLETEYRQKGLGGILY